MEWITVPAVVVLSVEPAQILSAHSQDSGSTWISYSGHGPLADAQRRLDKCWINLPIGILILVYVRRYT